MWGTEGQLRSRMVKSMKAVGLAVVQEDG
jgi:hypothetical protein